MALSDEDKRILDNGLWRGVNGGKLHLVKEYIDKGANVNVLNDSQETPLHRAAYYGDLEIVKYLCSKGANVDAKDKFGDTPLHITARLGGLGVVKYLVETANAEINAVNNKGDTPKSVAHQLQLYSVSKYLGTASQKNLDHNLLKFVKNGDLQEVQRLVCQGANVNCKDSSGKSPLKIAVEHKHLEIIKYLISFRKKNVSLINEDDDEDYDEGKPTSPNSDELHIAAQTKDLKKLKYLAQCSVDEVNLIDNCGKSPLQYAVESGDIETVKLLVKSGADVNLIFTAGYSPLQLACKFGYLEVVKFLINSGAKVDGACKEMYFREIKNTEISEIMRRYVLQDFIIKLVNKSNEEVSYKCLGGGKDVVLKKFGLEGSVRVTTSLATALKDCEENFNNAVNLTNDYQLENNLSEILTKFETTLSYKIKAESNKRRGFRFGIGRTSNTQEFYNNPETLFKKIDAADQQNISRLTRDK